MSSEEKITIDVIPFLCEAFAYKKCSRKQIDRLYQTNKYEFYRLAKESKYYNHGIIIEGDILQTEYSRKALGIILYLGETQGSETGNKIGQELMNIIKKCWPLAYNSVKNCNGKFDFEKFAFQIVDKDKLEDEVNTELFIAWYLAKNMNCDFVISKVLTRFEEMIYGRQKFSAKDSKIRYSHRTYVQESKSEVNKLKNRLFEHYGQMASHQQVRDVAIEHFEKLQLSIDLLFDSEMMSLSSLFNDIKIGIKEIEEILGLYWAMYQNKNTEKAGEFLVWGFYLKAMLKAYKQAKDIYFRNNKETMFVEFEHLEGEVEKLNQENTLLRNRLDIVSKENAELKANAEKKYIEQIVKLEREVEQLKKELVKEKKKDKELNALRELMFSLQSEDNGSAVYADNSSADNIDLNNVSGVIVGGHDRWQQKLKELVPHFKFINSENFDSRILDNCDYVFINPQYISHAIYYKVINIVRKKDIKVGYVNNNNENLALKEIKKHCNHH